MKIPSGQYCADIPCVLDTSVAINLLATGCAKKIVQSIPNELFVVEEVSQELESGRETRNTQLKDWDNLCDARLINIVTLDENSSRTFEELVIGEARQTLDDGEAATIAYALEKEHYVIIDEKKANKICSERFPHLQITGTMDLLSHSSIRKSISDKQYKVAILNALLIGNMHVPQEYLNWVVDLIGIENARKCPSLPMSIRSNSSNLSLI